MTAASTRPKAPATDIDTSDLSTSTVSAAIFQADRLRLDEARASLAAASDALDGWYARQTTEGHTYVADGHEVVQLIDAAKRELYRVRAVLIGELRDDEDERAVRVDRMLAESRARRAGVLPGGLDGGAPQNGGVA